MIVAMSANLIGLQNRFLGRGETVYDKLAKRREEKGALSDADLLELSQELSLPPALLRTVAKFYDDLRDADAAPVRVRVCNGEACAIEGASAAHDELTAGSPEGVAMGEVTCVGYCSQGPNALVEKGSTRQVVSLAADGAVQELITALEDGQLDFVEPVNELYHPAEGAPNVLMRGMVEGADTLAGARALGAYRALEKALAGEPGDVVRELAVAELRGRGGAGFPIHLKLRGVRDAASDDGRRYVVVNADEGDAGAFIDKELMERAPHSVIEGTVLAAFACGASEGFLYLRHEYPQAGSVLEAALAEASQAGLLGESILGSGFSFELKLVRGQGAYVVGEETSLLRSLEGVPAQVSPKPPYPASEGYQGKPTLVNNVETLANLPFIVREGGEAYAALGTERSRGTKLVSLNAAVARPGLYEVELGTSLRTLLFDMAGGLAGGKELKAVQVGGPLGGILGPQHLDLGLCFSALADAGGMLGHGGIIVFPEETDLVQIGRGLMKFCAVESCGKCFPCRIGSVRGTELFDRVLAGDGTQKDLELLADLNETMRYGSLCALGGAIPVPMDNLLTWFIDDFKKYIPDAATPARVNANLED